MDTARIEAFDVPPDADAAFLAAWAEAGRDAALHRALRADVQPRFVAVGSGDAHAVVAADGEPEGAGGVLLIAQAGDAEPPAPAWDTLRALLRPRRGYLGSRLLHAEGAGWVGVVRWSSPLMYARSLAVPEIAAAVAALPGPGPALYLPAPTSS